MNVIGITDEALYELVNRLAADLRKQMPLQRDKWIDTEEAMHMLRITSKTTLQKLRDTGQIRYSQPMPKHILYDSDSILAYLDKHARDTF